VASAVDRYTALKKLQEQLRAQCERQRGAYREQRRQLRQLKTEALITKYARAGNLKKLRALLRRRQRALERLLEKLAVDEAAFRRDYGAKLTECP